MTIDSVLIYQNFANFDMVWKRNDDYDDNYYFANTVPIQVVMNENSWLLTSFDELGSCLFATNCERDSFGNVRATIQGNTAYCTAYTTHAHYLGSVMVQSEWVPFGHCARAALPQIMGSSDYGSWAYGEVYCCSCYGPIQTSISSVECACSNDILYTK